MLINVSILLRSEQTKNCFCETSIINQWSVNNVQCTLKTQTSLGDSKKVAEYTLDV